MSAVPCTNQPGLRLSTDVLTCETAPSPDAVEHLRDEWDELVTATGGPVGMSDHTMGPDVAVAAVAMGASIIEKHLTLSREMEGPDHRASLEPDEFAEMVRGIRTSAETRMAHWRPTPGCVR